MLGRRFKVPKIAVELAPVEIGRLTKPGTHLVGVIPGLALQITPAGARSWVLRFKVGGKRREMGLGGYPAVTLARAREKAREARQAVDQGHDPILERQRARSLLIADQTAAQTFDQCAASYMKSKRAEWTNPKHAQQWETTLAKWASPILGAMLIRDVSRPQVLAVLNQPADPKQPSGPTLWTGKTETANRVRNRIELIIGWAAARDMRSGPNPAQWRGNLEQLLPKPSKIAKEKHQPAIQLDHAGEFMQALRQREGLGARALEFLALTAVRSHNVRAAQWSEIEMEAAVWRIPGTSINTESQQRMKGKRQHTVPLSAAALDLLRALPRVGDGALIFPSAKRGEHGQEAMLSDATLAAVMDRLGFKDRDGRGAVPHGLRSTFRDWAGERTSYPGDMAEIALAHALDSKTEAAYRRGDMLDKRRKMMEDWAGFLDTPMPKGGKVVPLERKTA